MNDDSDENIGFSNDESKLDDLSIVTDHTNYDIFQIPKLKIVENTINHFVNRIGICKKCGQVHGHLLSFHFVKTSIDIIPILLQKLRVREQLEQKGVLQQ